MSTTFIDRTLLNGINQKLLLFYGKEIDGRARYRVSWTTNETEKRVGEFNEFYGHIFLRTTIGMQWVPKYPYDKDRWVIEALRYIKNTEIIAELPGSYEPIFILKDKFGNYLPLNWKVVDNVVAWAEAKPLGVKLTDADFKSIQAEEDEEEIEYFENVLAEEGRSNLFAFENSAFIDSTKRFGGNDGTAPASGTGSDSHIITPFSN